MNHECSYREHFEELSALTAGGQIAEAEFVELREHLKECAYCRVTYRDFVDLVHDKIPLADLEVGDSAILPGFFPEASSYRDRFMARARKEGLALGSNPLNNATRSKRRAWFGLRFDNAQPARLAVAVLLLVVATLSYRLYQGNVRYNKLAPDAARNEQSRPQSHAELRLQPEDRTVTPSPPEPAARPDLASRPDHATDDELAKVRTDRAAAEARTKAVEEQLAKVAAELESLKTQNEATSLSREQLEKKLKDAEMLANSAKADLQEIRLRLSKDSLTIAAQDLEIEKLSQKLTAQSELLEEERNLLEASRDVRDLMGARNFHIADVFDVDSKGKDQRAFGRVFYTEGKSTLIIYAFDLNDRNDRNSARRNASFQVWGKRGPAQSPTHSLGLFQIDDQKQNRWVLRFEDPRILAEIDSVFVTVEPPGGSARPTGRQFLFAYLN